MIQQIDKQTYDEEYRICDFSARLSSDETVLACSALIYDDGGNDVSSSMLAEVTQSFDSKGVHYKLKGGTSLKRYALKIRITTTRNQKFEEPFTVCIL